MRQDFPILEYDPTRRAVIEPAEQIKPADISDHCVVCFFQEVLGSNDVALLYGEDPPDDWRPGL